MFGQEARTAVLEARNSSDSLLPFFYIWHRQWRKNSNNRQWTTGKTPSWNIWVRRQQASILSTRGSSSQESLGASPPAACMLPVPVSTAGAPTGVFCCPGAWMALINALLNIPAWDLKEPVACTDFCRLCHGDSGFCGCTQGGAVAAEPQREWKHVRK